MARFRGIREVVGRLRPQGDALSAATSPSTPADAFDPSDEAIIQEVRSYTMTSDLRIEALLRAIRHVTERGIPGALAECGVWRGGSVLAMVRQLQQLHVDDRELYLYDTFEGMTAPSSRDTSPFDPPALEVWQRATASLERPWGELFDEDVFNEHQVARLLHATHYPPERFHLVKGPVEATLPAHAPDQLALLRLDTDWHDSTWHELVHLYPRLSVGGVLIIDDYGHWEGCRQAVDEYFSTVAPPLLLQRVDYTGRIAVKC